ncbi:hypothetical protein [Methylobacterium sp. JK268]
MYFGLNGPDFIRVQRNAQSPIGDALDPDVLFSGTYDDGQVYFYQLAVSVASNSSQNYEVQFGRNFANVPLVIGCLKTSQSLVQNGATQFNSGEYLAPCRYTYNRYGTGRIVNWGFEFTAYKDRLAVTVNGLSGTCTFFVLDV